VNNRIRLQVFLALVLCLALVVISPGAAQRSTQSSAQILNGDFEGTFISFGTGELAQYWQAYDRGSLGAPQYKCQTAHVRDGLYSQMFWKHGGLFNAGILQVVGGTASPAALSLKAGRTFTAHVYMYSIYGAAGGTIEDNKIYKRIGIDPYGGTDPQSGNIIWTPDTMYGQDEVWVRLDCKAEAKASQITVFIEGYNVSIGGQDQVYIDAVTLEEEGVLTPTPTRPVAPTPTATPAINVVRTVGAGHQPKGVAVLPDLNRFLVANSGESTATMLDGFLEWRRTDFAVEGRPNYVAVDPDRCLAYIALTAANTVSVFNVCGSTVRAVGTVALGENQLPGNLAVLTTTNTIYVANTASASVSVIDGNTLRESRKIPVSPNPGQIAVNPRNGRVYVACRGYEGGGSVVVIDGNTQSVIATINLGLGELVPAPEPYGVGVNPVTNLVYVAAMSGKLVIINGASNVVMRAVSPPVATGLAAVAVNPATNNVFVTGAAGNTVFVYDADMSSWSYSLPAGSGLLGGIAVNPVTFLAMVSNTGQDNVSVLRDFGAYQPLRLFLPVLLKAVVR
jgi:YVTN family beta-propeller protein